MASHTDPVIIAGGGIGGLALALTCHSIGVPVVVLESVGDVKPLGVGINLQPNAVRELVALGLGDELAAIGVATSGYNLYSKHGGLIWGEPRGIAAGYNWPQYSIHRGELHMMLWRAAITRLGPEVVRTSSRVIGYSNDSSGVTASIDTPTGASQIRGCLLIGADGIHSAVRAQMHPGEGDAIWSGRILYRATTQAVPFLDGATMSLSGHESTKLVSYPISPVDPSNGLATINWIAQLSFDLEAGYEREDYSRSADVDEFLPSYDGWSFPWIDDIESLVRGADKVFKYPMVDRDPLPCWTDGRATLLGDAAHVMYPVGSNGASQAIVDGRKLGRAFLDAGLTPDALEVYESEMRPATEQMILRNRTAGPDHIMEIVEQRCDGVFDDIHDVIPEQELIDFAAGYKKTAGFAITELNESPPIIPD